MDELKRSISISVRNIVEFIYRTGDIDSGFSQAEFAEGSRLHRKIQKAQDGKYKAEVWLKYISESEHFNLTIEGRADGVIEEMDGGFCIDEIKTVAIPLDQIEDNYNPGHWAQAMCYASFFAIEKKLHQIDIRLTYCHRETEQIKYFRKTVTIDELRTFLSDLIEKFNTWAEMSAVWQKKRDDSLKKMQFPFSEYRKGQREMAVEIYKTIRDKKKLFVKAPTGIGKTVSSLFPALKAMGEGHTEKIFYLTAKTITRSVAENTFEILRKNDLAIKTVTITAKEKICCNHIYRCNPIDCKFAKGHFDRINAALLELLNCTNAFSMEIIKKYAEMFIVCPFELSLDLTLWCDTIVCDYNYVFDPQVYLKRFFYEEGGNYSFLVDEAHNLVDRAREMFSAEITKGELLQAKKAVKNFSREVASKLNKCNSVLIRYRKRCEEEGVIKEIDLPSGLVSALKEFVEICKEMLAKNPQCSADQDILNAFFNASAFVKVAELYDERYITYAEKRDDNVKVKLFCIDPSHLLKEALKRGRSSVFFSATLQPAQYFMQILGGDTEDNFLMLRSPFDVKNRCILITRDISTRFCNRDSNSSKIVNCIKSVINSKRGNYIVFFPSYQYMKQIYDLAVTELSGSKLYLQSSSMTEKDREDYLSKFQPDPPETVVGFCVLGGIFSEGIDLKNDRLIGVIVIGVGLPQICLERDIIRNYFQNKYRMGFEYAYVFPGMNKVLQAAGRLIRSENDQGIIVLVDDRFTEKMYVSLFPQDWYPHQKIIAESISKHTRDFWLSTNSTECK